MSNSSKKPDSNHKELLTTAMLAVLLNIPKASLSKWRSTGEVTLPYIKIGHAVRYDYAQVKIWLEENTQHKINEVKR